MADKQAREHLSTRISANAREVIERVAAKRRTTPAQVARVLIEDGVKKLATTARTAA